METTHYSDFRAAPPARRANAAPRSSKWDSIAEDLRRNPGRWRVIATDAPSSMVSKVKNAAIRSFSPAGAFDATLRMTEGQRTGDLWACYRGDAEGASE